MPDRRGRPPLPVGGHGEIGVYTQPSGAYRAQCRFRDADGAVRMVARTGQTKAAAKRALSVALVGRQADNVSGISRDTKIDAVMAEWLERVAGDDTKAVKTVEHYRYTVDRYVKDSLGQLRLSEASPSRLDDVIQAIAARHGKGAARSTRSVLSGAFGYAVTRGALNANPVREVGTIPQRKKTVRALTDDEVTDLTDRLRTDPRAVATDLPDLIEFMLDTGCRIGEALAVRDASLEHGVIEINATLIRVKGVGLVIQPRPKTAAGWRRIAVPDTVTMLVERRNSEPRFRVEGVVFPSPHANSLRDPSNTAADMREVLDRFGYDWVTSHVFRKTVATKLDQAGLSAREIADHLGHAQPSMTQNLYMGRKVASSKAAAVLDRR